MEGIYVRGPEKSLWVSTQSLISLVFTDDGNIVVEYFPDAKQQYPSKFIANQQIVLFETKATVSTFWMNGITLIPRENLQYIEQDTRQTNFGYRIGPMIKTLGVQGTPSDYLEMVLSEDQRRQLWPGDES